MSAAPRPRWEVVTGQPTPAAAGPPVAEVAAAPARTKLRPPLPRVDAIARERPLAELAAALERHPVILVAAPAGYGKTTLLAAFARSRSDLPFAWVSLDEEDDEPTRFLAALIAAVESIDPELVGGARTALEGLQNLRLGARAVVVIDALINDILAVDPPPFALVLDDLHRLADPSLHRALDYLVERQPPALKLVVASRGEPPLSLARWRADGRLAEIRPESLRFTPAEAGRFLNGSLGLGLGAAQVERLTGRAEGWPAGLGLIAGVLGRTPDAGARAELLSHPERIDPALFGFLNEQVLATLEPDDRDFLLAVSVLSVLTPEACRAVSGRADAAGALDDLYRRNLFVVALDEASATYRFHDLVRDLLRRRLAREQPERVAELHRRAARVESESRRRMTHLLAAEEWEEAAALAEEIGETMVESGQMAPVEGWIAALPQAVREQHPRLDYLLGRGAWARWDLATADRHYARALAGFEAAGDVAAVADTLAYRSHVLATAADFAAAAATCDRAMTLELPDPMRAQILLQRIWLALAAGDPEAVTARLTETVDLVESTRSREAVLRIGDKFHSHLLGAVGASAEIERFCRLAAPLLEGPVNLPQITVEVMTAWLLWWRGERATALSDRVGGLRWVILDLGVLRGIEAAAAGDAAASEAACAAVLAELAGDQPAGYRHSWGAAYLTTRARCGWMLDRRELLADSRLQLETSKQPREWPVAPLARAFTRGLEALAEGRLEAAEPDLRRAVELQAARPLFAFIGDTRLPLAHLLRIAGRESEALAVMAAALAHHRADDSPGMLAAERPEAVVPLLELAIGRGVEAEIAGRALAVIEARRATRRGGRRGLEVPATGQRLSAREVEVLRLVAAGASNAEIAARLIISLHTVKRHVANLLVKLDAANRAQAGARARELGLG